MSHNDGMPEKKSEYEMQQSPQDSWHNSGWNACHDAFTKYLAERKTMDEKAVLKVLLKDKKCPECQVGVDRPKCFHELSDCPRHDVVRQCEIDAETICSHFAPPTEKNTPEKKLNKLDFEITKIFQELKVLHDVPKSVLESLEGLIRNRNPEPTKADVGLDRVYSSTGAEPDANKQNVKIGVTAHCRCGNVFIDDIKSGLPKSLRQPTKAENGLVKLDKLKVNAVIKKSFDIENLKKNRYALQYLPETLKELLKAVDEATEEICETFGTQKENGLVPLDEKAVKEILERNKLPGKDCRELAAKEFCSRFGVPGARAVPSVEELIGRLEKLKANNSSPTNREIVCALLCKTGEKGGVGESL